MKERKRLLSAARGALPLTLVFLAARCAAPAARWASPAVERQAAPFETSPAKPVLVVDLDDTLVDGGLLSSVRLVLGFPYSSVPPFDGASDALGRLAEDWNILLLTSRAGDRHPGLPAERSQGHPRPRRARRPGPRKDAPGRERPRLDLVLGEGELAGDSAPPLASGCSFERLRALNLTGCQKALRFCRLRLFSPCASRS